MFGENSNFEHIAIILALESVYNMSLDCQKLFSIMIDACARASITMYIKQWLCVEGTM